VNELSTAQRFLVWITSTAGLGVAVPFIVGAIKKLWPQLEGWAALLITLGVAVFVGGGATALLELGWYQYLEPYWGVIVAIVSVVLGGGISFGTSQLIYHNAPRTGDGDK